jgi:hypothetical protein
MGVSRAETGIGRRDSANPPAGDVLGFAPLGDAMAHLSRRRHPRARADAPAFVVVGDYVREARLLDVSEGGARVEMGPGVAPGEFVWLTADLEGATIDSCAEVIHRVGRSCGVRFLGACDGLDAVRRYVGGKRCPSPPP